MEIKIRDLRKKDQYKIDDAYLNGYAAICGVYATAVYNSLSRHADFNTQECFPSIETIAKQHNISKPSVIKAIKELLKWNIVSVQKERDLKTKRQKNNIYILTDKSQWITKPSKPHLLGAESMSDSDPSKRQNKSRVNHVDCKDTHVKDTHIKVIAEQAPQINEVIDLFKKINPNNDRLFANKTQRLAVDRLLKKIGFEKLSATINYVASIFGEEYAPVITTPVQLENKLAQLIAYYKRSAGSYTKEELELVKDLSTTK